MRPVPLALVILTFGAPARAGDRARLELVRGAGASECPDERALSDLVATRLGYEPFAKEAAIRIAVRFVRERETLRSQVALFDPSGLQKGERVLTSAGSGCDELASTTALTISIMLDPRAGMATRPTPPPPPPPPPPEPSPFAPVAPPPAEPAPKTPSAIERIRARTRMAVAVSIGASPAIGPSVQGALGVGRGWWSVDAEIRVDLPAAATLGNEDVRAGFIGGGLVPCGHLGIGYACLGAWVGALRGEIVGATPPVQSTLHAFVGPRLGTSVPIAGPFELDVHADLLFAPTSTTLRAGGVDIWSSPIASALVGIGVLGRFP